MPVNKTLIMIPTYNEAENIERIYTELSNVLVDADLLFVDDNSPDGTGDIADRLAQSDERVRVIHRPGKLGVGAAHKDGINWAYDNGYQRLLTMDCDFTHSPSMVGEFLDADDAYDIAVGTRFVRDDSLGEWVWYRKTLTRAAHRMTVTMLGMPYDASGAFRFYRIDRIPREIFDRVRDGGYSFFWESLFILWRNGCKVREIPIDLPARTYGHSKMRYRDVVNGVTHLFATFFRYHFNRRSIIFTRPDRANTAGEWDKYWAANSAKDESKRTEFALYDVIAQFYRNRIIKGTLAHFTSKHFAPNAKVLHAGCGGGEVDDAVIGRLNVTALDISQAAISRYAQRHGERAAVMLGDIMDTKLPSGEMDGVYNLGVMEHFSDSEIRGVLSECARVLKPEGRIVLFWPPTYGLSVWALRLIHFVLNSILRRNIRLHPDEPSLLQSRAQARSYMQVAGFRMEEYYFGIRDLFTYSVVVGTKIANQTDLETDSPPIAS